MKHKIYLAYSGGLDSHCLLHMTAAGVLELDINHAELIAVYINHGLSPHADAWQHHCAAVCQALDIKFQAIPITVDRQSGLGVEATARAARYAAFATLLQAGDILLTAHHVDDQAETFLLQALRGSGVKGLAAMPTSKSLGSGKHLRPLLNKTRAQLEEYAKAHQLIWIEDESNSSLTFARNYLRHQVMPLLEQRWPGAAAILATSSRYCAQATVLLDELAQLDYESCCGHDGTLVIEKLQSLSTARQHNVVRYWLAVQQCSVPGETYLQRIFSEVIVARDDASPEVAWQGGQVCRYQGKLYALNKPVVIDQVHANWDWRKPLALNSRILQIEQTVGSGFDRAKLPKTLRVDFRRGGEKIKPIGQAHHRELKKLLQEWGVPPWLRDTIPLIYADDELIAVVGYCYAQHYAAEQGQPGVEFMLKDS